MARFFTAFNNYTTGQQPSDWTSRWNTSNASWTTIAVAPGVSIGDKVVQRSGSQADLCGLSWNKIGSVSDVEIVTRFTMSSTAGQVDFIFNRGSGGANTENCYTGLYFPADSNIYLGRRVNGAVTVVSNTSFPMTANSIYWARLRSIGNSHFLKVWDDAASEPVAWNLTGIDSLGPSTGYVGIMSRQNYDYFFGLVGIGTNGDTAPTEPLRLKSPLLLTR